MIAKVSLPAANTINETAKRDAAAAFRQQGVVWIQNVLTRTFVNRLSRAFSQQYCSLARSELARRYALVGDKRYMISVDIVPPFHSTKLYANDGLMPIFHELLGPDCVISSFGSVVAFPGASDQPVHFDFPPLFESEELCASLPPYAITLVVPLVDLNESTGSTAVWEGSHRRVGSRQQLSELADSGDFTEASLPTPKMGEVFLMDFRLIHAGTANQSEHPRPILYIVYSRPWFREELNFSEQPPINLSQSQLLKVPKKHRHLFAAARPMV